MISNTHNTYKYMLNKELTEIYITHSLRHFAISMVGIFVPIFLLERNMSFPNVLFFYFFQSIFQISLYVFGSKIPSKIGIKHSIFLSMPFMIIFFIFMYNLELIRPLMTDFLIVFISSIIFSLAMFFYWFAFHVDFVKFTNDQNEGKQIGTLQAFSTFCSILGPLFGGLIIVNFSFNILFIITSCILLVSTVPLFFSEDIRIDLKYKIKDVLKFEKPKNNLFFFAEGARQESALVFWPIFLFFISIQMSSVGLLYSITNLLLAVFSIFVGRVSDVFNKSLLMRVGSIMHALSLVARTFARSLFMIFSIQSIGAIFFPFLAIPYTSIIYTRARRRGIALFVIDREIFFHLGRIFTIILCFVTYIITSAETALVISIIFGSICAIIMSFNQEDRDDSLELTGH